MGHILSGNHLANEQLVHLDRGLGIHFYVLFKETSQTEYSSPSLRRLRSPFSSVFLSAPNISSPVLTVGLVQSRKTCFGHQPY